MFLHICIAELCVLCNEPVTLQARGTRMFEVRTDLSYLLSRFWAEHDLGVTFVNDNDGLGERIKL